jgi:hypothetical protein
MKPYGKPSQVPPVVRLPHRTKGQSAVSAVERLPAGSRLVHIGPPKTGTTTLQRAMHREREAMARHGVRYAGPTSRPQEAVFELIIGSARRPDHPMTRWIELVRDVEAAGGMRVCISNEELAAADDERAVRVVHDLGGPSVHVVSAVRRLDKLLPSQWQQRLKRRPGIPPFETWLEIVLSEKSDDPQWVHFWSHHDLRETARRWIAAGPGHVSFIVLDESDPGFLPSTFEQLLGLRSGLLTDGPQDLNRSLTSEESLLLQKLSAMASERGWSLRQYAELVRPLRMSLQGRPPGAHGRPIVIPTWARARIEELTLERRDVLLDSGARVIGDLDSLGSPPPADDETFSPGDGLIEAERVGDALVAAFDEMMKRQAQTKTQAQEAADELVRVRRSNADLRAQLRAGRSSQQRSGGARDDRRPVSQVSGRELARIAGARLWRRLRRSAP